MKQFHHVVIKLPVWISMLLMPIHLLIFQQHIENNVKLNIHLTCKSVFPFLVIPIQNGNPLDMSSMNGLSFGKHSKINFEVFQKPIFLYFS